LRLPSSASHSSGSHDLDRICKHDRVHGGVAVIVNINAVPKLDPTCTIVASYTVPRVLESHVWIESFILTAA
jgi:hypothetical protein